MLAVIAADTHISERTWNHPSRAGILHDSFFGFSQLIDLCVENRCPLVLCGDCLELMHDPRPSTVTVDFIRKQVDRLTEIGQKLYYILGQHDGAENPSWLSAIHRDCVHFGNRTIQLGPYTMYGVDYFDAVYFSSVIPSIPTDVFGLIMHEPWLEFAGNKADKSMSLAGLPDVPLVITGDMHEVKYQTIGKKMCVSTGATHMRTLREPVSHYCLSLEENGTVKVHSLLSRPVITFTANNHATWPDQLEQVAALAATTYSYCLNKSMWKEVAMPLIIIDDLIGVGAEAAIRERVPSSHVLIRSDLKNPENVSDGLQLLQSTLQLTAFDGLLGEKLIKTLDQLNASPTQKAICLALSRGESALELFKHYAKTNTAE